RSFAKAAGRLAKTDRIDAGMLALFGERMEPEERPATAPADEARRSLFDRRRQLTDMLTQERNRLWLAPKPLRKEIKHHVDWLRKQLKDLDQRIEKSMEADPAWKAKDECLRETKGVGPNLSLGLLESFRNWEGSIVGKSLRWWESRLLIVIAVSTEVNGIFSGGGAAFATRSTWPL